MPKVFGLHEIEVPPGVTPEEHEQFLTKVLASAPVLPSWKTYLLKGERGERAGKLLLLHEIETVEARDRYFPGPEEVSEEWGQFVEQNLLPLADRRKQRLTRGDAVEMSGNKVQWK